MHLALIDPALRDLPLLGRLRAELGADLQYSCYSERRWMRSLIRGQQVSLFPIDTEVPASASFDEGQIRQALGSRALARENWSQLLQRARAILSRLQAFYERQSVDAILIRPGSSLPGILALWLARKLGLRVLLLRNRQPYGPPQIELDGLQAQSLLEPPMYNATFLRSEQRCARALKTCLAVYRASRASRLPDQQMPIAGQPAWSRRLMRVVGSSLIRPMTSNRNRPRPAPRERYLLLPFQSSQDPQLQTHSPLVGTDMALLLQQVEIAAREIDPQLKIVVLLDPQERWSVLQGYRALAEQYPHVRFVDTLDCAPLLQGAEAVVTVNAMLGFEALLMDRPVVTLGRSFYTLPGIVTPVRSAVELPQALRRALCSTRSAEQTEALLGMAQAHLLCFADPCPGKASKRSATASRIRALLGLAPLEFAPSFGLSLRADTLMQTASISA